VEKYQSAFREVADRPYNSDGIFALRVYFDADFGFIAV